jgi:glutathione S-transferase
METARLYTFGISHYCEKARWALEYLAVPFEEVRWPPGAHIAMARRLGARKSSLPVLAHGDAIVQGSDQILDWAEERARGNVSLRPSSDPERAAEVERRADEVLGVHVRRLFYASTLTDHPHVAKRPLFDGVKGLLRIVGHVTWSAVRKKMIALMDARPAAAAESAAIVERELDWLDGLLGANPFLAGGRFSRVDLTMASLLAPFARPQEMQIYAGFVFPQPLAEIVDRWQKRPSFERVRELYRDYRRPSRVD